MPVYKDHSFRLGASTQGDDVYEISQSIKSTNIREFVQKKLREQILWISKI